MNELLVADMALVMSSMGVSLLFLLGYTRSLLMSFVGLVQARWLPPPLTTESPTTHYCRTPLAAGYLPLPYSYPEAVHSHARPSTHPVTIPFSSAPWGKKRTYGCDRAERSSPLA